jgi:hypothetical protein
MSLERLIKRAKEIMALAVFSGAVAISGCSVSNNKFSNLPNEALSKVAHHNLNMENPNRFFKKDLEKILNAKNEEGDIALILLARSDHNDNFGNYFAKKAYSEVVQRYRTFAFEIESDEEILYRARDVSQYGKISFLMVCGHGHKRGITITEDYDSLQNQAILSSKTMHSPIEEKMEIYPELNAIMKKNDNNTLCVSDVDRGKMSELHNYLSDRAIVFLNSCSLGEGGYGTDNFASALASQLILRKRCRVFASKDPFGCKDIQFQYENGKIVDIVLKNDENTLKFFYNSQLSR